ncbi:MAG: ankyrin repeat domain-containing protein [Spirochaetales bacterium]|nr:ankyrin repeat domain-containing protein [Spirochaetales bacterium]
MSKYFTLLLIILFSFSCTSISKNSNEDLNLEEFRVIALKASDIMSINNGYEYGSLITIKGINNASEDAQSILTSSWGINDKDEFNKRLNMLINSGQRETYIKTLNILLTKKDKLNDPELLLNIDTWIDDINSGIITYNDILRMQTLLVRSKYISYFDIHLFELERLSALIRWGYAARYLTKERAIFLMNSLAYELSKYNITWLDFGNSYIAGLTFLWYDSKKTDANIKSRAMSILDLIHRYSWSEDDWQKAQKLREEVKNSDQIDNNLFKNSLKFPKLPKNIEVNPQVAILFDPNRMSEGYVEKYTWDYKLFNAINKNDVAEVKSIVEQTSVNITDLNLYSGESYIYQSVELNNMEITKILLEQNFDPNLKCTGNGWAPLHKAVMDKNYSAIELLLKYNADIDIRTDLEKTPLGYAIKSNDINLVTKILDFGANPVAGFYIDNNPTYWGALNNVSEEISKIVIDKIPNKSLNPRIAFSDLKLLIDWERKEEFKSFIQKSNNLEYRDNSGMHILYYSLMEKNRYWASKILIDNNFNLNLPGLNNSTIMYPLCKSNNFEMILEIIDRGFNINEYDYNTGKPITKLMSESITDTTSEEYTSFINELNKRDIQLY